MTALLLTCIFPNIFVDGHGPQGPLIGWLVALADAAVRALLVAGIVWAGLRLLGMRNVIAQKAAWGLVLAGALLMPFAASWAARSSWFPAEATLVVPAQAWLHAAATAVLPQTRKEVLYSNHPVTAPSQWTTAQPAATAQADKVVAAPASSPAARFPAPAISNSYFAGGGTEPRPANPAKEYFLPLSDLAWMVYAMVGLALLLRLFYGLGAAVGLWQSAEPIQLDVPYLAAGLRLRSSRRVSSPVTVGSGVVLPADYDEWDGEKLRIVLAHERSHVRQGDFYLQALAGLYAALFWFSPLGWWLKRKLSDLSEAISDRAGLEEAVSHASYARILLEFAALPRRTQIGVAMARTGRLSQRIERLLNENCFRQAFAGGPRRFIAVLVIVFGALFSATALIRVEAARILSQPVIAQGPTTGQSHPENATDGGPAIAPAAAKAPVAPVVTQGPQAPAPAGAAPTAATAPPPPGDSADADQEAPEPSTSTQCTRSSSSYTYSRSSGHSHGERGYGYAYSSNGESYAFVSGNERHAHFSGDLHTGEIDKARNMAHGDFLWFSHNGKSYVVDDPQTITQIQAMYKPMEDLGRQQEELGKQQEVLGRQQEELGRKQEQASVPTPDIAKEMADLNAAAASLQAKKSATITVDELADLQSKIGDLQGKLGELQGEVGTKQGELGREQGRLGAQQGRLGERQGRLGAEQGRLARDADVKIKSIIDESLKDGKAKPVQ
jgi:beta-lactamase regulating signal transducer with metallopeptidase domain